LSPDSVRDSVNTLADLSDLDSHWAVMHINLSTEKLRRAAVAIAAAGAVAVSTAGLWAEHPRWRPRFTLEQITQVATPGQWTISPDGTLAAYTVAGYYFGFPVIPRLGEANNIRVVSLATGEIRKLTSGAEAKTRPVFSPGSDRVAYEAGGDIWVAEVATGRSWRVTIDLAADREPAWAPDGKRLAFVSSRGGRTGLWAVSVEGERHGLVRLTGDEVNASDPDWSPDGERVAFTGRRGGDHFYASGVYVVPSKGGAVVRVTPADTSTNFGARWAPDGRRLALLSDRSGYVHVWTMAPDGTGAREFDTGPYDSMSPHFWVRPVWSRDGQRIQISVNRDGSFELAVLEVASGRVEVVAGGGGQYHEVGWSRSGGLVYAHETAWAPPDLYVRESGEAARQLTFSSEAAFRPAHFARMRRVSFTSLDGSPIHGFLLTPSGLQDGERLPAIVNLHPNTYGQFYDHWNPFAHYLVQSGYVMLMADQRGSAGYGRAFRESGVGAGWDNLIDQDVKAMTMFLREQPPVDPDRIGVMGLSQGGYRTLQALVKSPELYRAGIDMMGPADRRSPFVNRNAIFHVGVPPEKDPDLWDRISPITQIDRLRVPLMIIHSDRDLNVDPGQSYNLTDELERQQKDYEVVYYPDEAHGLAYPAHQLDSYRRILTFFDRYLK
jgi:dipeptidyl aminopeptidase/acylaminoacyl peptidase